MKILVEQNKLELVKEKEKKVSYKGTLFGNLRLLDLITFIYLSLITLFILLFNHRVENWYLHVIGHLISIAGILFFLKTAGQSNSKVLLILRDIYPFFLYTFLFKEISVIVNVFFPFWLEKYLLNWDKALFGGHPTVLLQNKYRVWLTEFMAFSYSSYYFLLPLAGVITFLVKRKNLFRSFIFNLSFTFYFCYLSYLFLTARGPQQTLKYLHLPRETAGFFDSCVSNIQQTASIVGAAFPSSHVAAVWIALIFIFKATRITGFLILPLVFALTFSTVYLQYHYAVDAIAGVLVVFITYPLGRFFENRFDNTKNYK